MLAHGGGFFTAAETREGREAMKPQHKKRLSRALKSNDLEESLRVIIEAFSDEYTRFSMSLKAHPGREAEILAQIDESAKKKWLWILRILSRSENQYNVAFRICNMQIPDQFRTKMNRILVQKIYPSWVQKGWSNQIIRLSRILKITISPDDIELMAKNKKSHGRGHSALVLEKCAEICRLQPQSPVLV
ncbi:MAG: hypothetical protein UV67_C0003G0030 [Parcubacteria group bacterium GW2011_GWC1_43_12]|nr:MAG: hypothetical protein UV67_C0003G0030 [Parcubacteria group bacterium GW2011_GWC1_43_12]